MTSRLPPDQMVMRVQRYCQFNLPGKGPASKTSSGVKSSSSSSTTSTVSVDLTTDTHSLSASVTSSATPTQSKNHVTQSVGPAAATAGLGEGSHLPVAAVAGSVVGALVVLTMLCLAALFVRCRRISHRNRPLGPHSEAALLEQGVDTRLDPLILYEKNMNPAGGASSETLNSRLSSALPAGAEFALVTMAEEMCLLRGQVQRLGLDRQGGTVAVEEQPPAYETR
ncbi:hypothetical protein DFH09DRAFT_1070415 [Mycena vulgaris]|nr:hypothetical protein DFH09DRAFT_1070415 [Mycena vulgaris]